MLVTADIQLLGSFAYLNSSGGAPWQNVRDWLQASEEQSTRTAIDSPDDNQARDSKYEARVLHQIVNAIESAEAQLAQALENEQVTGNTF